MVIAFIDNMGGVTEVYPIHYISMDTDENDTPIDIEIASKDRGVLDAIAEHCSLGYNCQEVMNYDCAVENEDGGIVYPPAPTGVYEALYARLDKFIILSSFHRAFNGVCYDGNVNTYIRIPCGTL